MNAYLDRRIGVGFIAEESDAFGIPNLQIRNDNGSRRRFGFIPHRELLGLQRQLLERNKGQTLRLSSDAARAVRLFLRRR